MITHTGVTADRVITSNDLQLKDKIAAFTSNPGMHNHSIYMLIYLDQKGPLNTHGKNTSPREKMCGTNA